MDITEAIFEVTEKVTRDWRKRREAETYPLEDIRSFLGKRPWLRGDGVRCLLSAWEYEELKARRLKLPSNRVRYLRAFMDGWKRARE